MRRWPAILSAVTGLAITAATSAGATTTTPTLRSSPSLVQFGNSVTLTGNAGTSGKVRLQADPFPFRRGYHTIATTQASSSGSYSFNARPSHANRYRITVTRGGHAVKSARVSVYVVDRVLALSCNLCTGSNAPGPNTLTVKFSAKAPPGRVAVRGPVYFYYGLVGGSVPPPTVSRVKKVALHRSGHTLSYTVTYTVDFPTTAFEFRVAACFKAAEAKDGVGLPAHHHCGQRTLTRRQYLGYLG